MAVFAGVLLLASIVFFALEAPFFWTLLYIVGLFILVGVLIKFTLWRIKKGKFKGIFLNTAQNGYVASEFAKELIGKKGEAI